LVEALILGGEIALNRKDCETAHANLKKAVAIANTIAAAIPSEEDRQFYHNRPVIKRLTSLIASLKSVLAPKR
jgi:hypothetical protein